jgi:thymidylate synthase (FAD)
MKVTLQAVTPKPIELIYRGYRTCYSKDRPSEIEIPKIPVPAGGEDITYVPDNQKMAEFIEDKLMLGHETPLEHVSLTFLIEGVSRAMSHQLVRHRHTSPNQQSQRYVEASNFGYVVPQSILNNREANVKFHWLMEAIRQTYEDFRELGIPKEDARFVLPEATTTNLIISMNARELRHVLSERLCTHAQWEIRDAAWQMYRLAKERLPFLDCKMARCLTCTQCCRSPYVKELK